MSIEAFRFVRLEYGFAARIFAIQLPKARAATSKHTMPQKRMNFGQGFGRLESLPAFEAKIFEAATKKAMK